MSQLLRSGRHLFLPEFLTIIGHASIAFLDNLRDREQIIPFLGVARRYALSNKTIPVSPRVLAR